MSRYGYHLVFYEKDSRERKMIHYYFTSEKEMKGDYEVMKEKGGQGQIVACLGPGVCPEKECLLAFDSPLT